MYLDRATSGEKQNQFLEYCQTANVPRAVDFSAVILTSGHWPGFATLAVALPEEMAKTLASFITFYKASATQKTLTWLHSHGMVTMHSKFGSVQYKMIVNTYQACVLCLFNSQAEISVQEVASQTFPDSDSLNEIRLVLASLAFGSYPILRKKGANSTDRTINPSDVFTVNEGFTTQKRNFKIPACLKVSAETVTKNVMDEQRNHSIDACLVRVMKARKTLEHNELTVECISQLSSLFKPVVKVIKQRIEILIIQEYLKRNEEANNVYEYVA
jgi:hypothetical protein